MTVEVWSASCALDTAVTIDLGHVSATVQASGRLGFRIMACCDDTIDCLGHDRAKVVAGCSVRNIVRHACLKAVLQALSVGTMGLGKGCDRSDYPSD